MKESASCAGSQEKRRRSRPTGGEHTFTVLDGADSRGRLRRLLLKQQAVRCAGKRARQAGSTGIANPWLPRSQECWARTDCLVVHSQQLPAGLVRPAVARGTGSCGHITFFSTKALSPFTLQPLPRCDSTRRGSIQQCVGSVENATAFSPKEPPCPGEAVPPVSEFCGHGGVTALPLSRAPRASPLRVFG